MSDRVQLAVVGSGPSGLGAAIAAAAAGARVVLFDENGEAGGQLRYRSRPFEGSGSDVTGPELAVSLTGQAIAAGVDIRTDCRVWGAFQGRALGVECDGASIVIEAERILFATGSVDRSQPFPGGSLPGVFTARAVQILLNVHLMRPGRRFALIADRPLATELARDIELSDGEVVITLPASMPGVVAHGNGGVERLTANGSTYDVDVIVIAAGRLPDAGLALMAECAAGYSPALGGFVPRVDDWMETTVTGIFAAGDCVGACDADVALAEGAFAGISVAGSLGLVRQTRRAEARAAYLKAAGNRAGALSNVASSFDQIDRVSTGATAE